MYHFMSCVITCYLCQTDLIPNDKVLSLIRWVVGEIHFPPMINSKYSITFLLKWSANFGVDFRLRHKSLLLDHDTSVVIYN